MNSYREDVLPTEERYALVEIDTSESVEDAATKLFEFSDPDEVRIPSDTAFELYVVYDQDGNEVTV